MPVRSSDTAELVTFLRGVPAVRQSVSASAPEAETWWVKLTIDIEHPLAWRVVQELGHVLNYVSVDERLPTAFYPVSPPPYMNGGPKEFLSWVIEPTDGEFTPNKCVEWLRGRLPRPADDLARWDLDDDD